MSKENDSRYATAALVLMALLGAALVFIFPGSPEQDTEYHFLMARTAWSDHAYFVNVWARPLYTAVFAGPALLGFSAARLFAVALGVVTAWQTWRLARDLELDRAWLVVPLLLCQPVFFELFPDMLTEPLFALVFVVALRWHLRGWRLRGILAASLLPLARPEGVFVCLLWGAWILWEEWDGRESLETRMWRLARLTKAALLASGVFLWWLAALCISGDPLFIVHNWPVTWHQDTYGHATLLGYAARCPEFTGELLIVPVLIGLALAMMRRGWSEIVSVFLLLFVLHSVFRAYGLFGEAGYPRYMVSVAPAIAVITLLGWNAIFTWLAKYSRPACAVLGPGVLALSMAQSFLYLNSFTWARDAVAIREMSDWLRGHPQRYERLIWSNARMCVIPGLNLQQSPTLVSKPDGSALSTLRDAPSGTLVFWDNHIGPDSFGLTAADIVQAGYKLLRVRHYSLAGIFNRDMNGRKLDNRELDLSLLYKP